MPHIVTLPCRAQTPVFALQFPIERIPACANRYPQHEDVQVLEIGRAARERGHYLRDEFRLVCRWKTPRSGPLVAANSDAEVEDATGAALAPDADDAERFDALRSLSGVEWATASVLLHLAEPDSYPILDFRALHALGVSQPAGYSLAFWRAYRKSWLELRSRAGVGGRTLDQALWQWSKEQAALLG